MERTDYQWQIPVDAEVFGAEGDKVGKVIDVQPTYFIVEKGFFFPSDYQIPTAAISSVDGDKVYLSVTKDQALNGEWDYTTTTATAGTGVAGTAGYAGETAGYAETAGTTTERAMDGETMRVPVHEEELVATKRERELGDVQVTKDVVAEERVLDVPVSEERVRVTRRTVDRDAAPGDHVFEEETIDVPIRGEEVELEKRARVAEEIEISKEDVERTERVAGTVRKERVRVEENVDDALRMRDTGEYEGDVPR
jgi:uncharacterized protein (TIGR02271 family)